VTQDVSRINRLKSRGENRDEIRHDDGNMSDMRTTICERDSTNENVRTRFCVFLGLRSNEFGVSKWEKVCRRDGGEIHKSKSRWVFILSQLHLPFIVCLLMVDYNSGKLTLMVYQI
jgi:hypothetical protein